MTRQPDYYRVLGVAADSEDVVIRAAYRALMLKYHPDTFKGDRATADRKAKEINAAYEVLGDPLRRKQYDRQRGPSQAGASTSQRNSTGNASARWKQWASSWAIWPQDFRIGPIGDLPKALAGFVIVAFVINAIEDALTPSPPNHSQESLPTPPTANIQSTPAPQPLAQQAPPRVRNPLSLRDWQKIARQLGVSVHPQPERPHASQAQAEPQIVPLTSEQVAEVQAEGLNPDRVFRPQDRFTVAGHLDQQLWPAPNNPAPQSNSINVSSEIPVSEIYSEYPGNPALWYHVQGGWLQGPVNEVSCSNCASVSPVTRSDQDALAEDAYLLKVLTQPVVAPGSHAIVFQPGAAQMKAACNIVASPFTVARQHRQRWVGYFISDGRDTYMLSNAPVLQAGENIMLDNAMVLARDAQWIHATTSDDDPNARQGWIPAACIAGNVQ